MYNLYLGLFQSDFFFYVYLKAIVAFSLKREARKYITKVPVIIKIF